MTPATEAAPATRMPRAGLPPARVRPTRVLWLAGYVAIVLVPVALMAATRGLPPRSIAVDVGAALGFAVFVLFGLQIVIPARTALSRPIGLDVLLRLHRHTGLIALALVVGHVIVIMADDPGRLRLLDVVHAPVRAKAAVLGTVALVALTVTSLWRARTGLRYERWRQLHGALGLAVVVLTFVHVVGVGRFSRSGPLLLVSFAVLGLAGGAFAYLRAGRPFMASMRPYRIRAVRPEAGGATTLEVEADGPGRPFRPGQFAWIKLSSSPYGFTEHPFSFASSAAEPSRVSFTIKGIGDFTSGVRDLTPGATVLVDGPHGSYEPAHPDADFLLVAAGIGITPIMSLLRTAADRRDRRRFTLLYGSRQWGDITFRTELGQLEGRLKLTVGHVLSQPPPQWRGESGRIRAEVLERALATMPGPLNAFLCGPPAMVDDCVAALAGLGLSESEIHAERFTSA